MVSAGFCLWNPQPGVTKSFRFSNKVKFPAPVLKKLLCGPTQTHPAVPWFVTVASLSICIGQRPRQGLRPGLEVQGPRP